MTLFTNATVHYKRAMDVLGVRLGPGNASALGGCVDPAAARSALAGYAKAVSWLPGRQDECRLALACWRRRDGQDVIGDSEACAVEFCPSVLDREWFGRLVGF